MKKTLRIWQAHRVFHYTVIIVAVVLWFFDQAPAINILMVVAMEIVILFYVNTQIIETKRIIKKIKKQHPNSLCKSSSSRHFTKD